MMRRTALALLAAIALSVASEPSVAQSRLAEGKVGYLQEWELTGSLALSEGGSGLVGPITLRHVGLCSAEGVEQKSGTLELRVPLRSSRIQGIVTLAEDQCRLDAAETQTHYSGLMTCHDGHGVPISFSILPMQQARD